MEFKNTKQKLTEEEFNQFVSNYNLELPISYKNHMMNCNGGKPVLNYFEGKGIHYFHSIKHGQFGTLEDVLNKIGNILPDNFFPFAYDGGGNQFCISLNKDDYGKVYFCALDVGDVRPSFLADSFEVFLNELNEEEDY